VIKKAILFIAVAALHFALCVAVVSVGNIVSPSHPGQYHGLFQVLAFFARILYFPLISLGLYSRQYFPGNLIYLVVVSNSILWALGIFLLIGGYRKVKGRR
jgi:hypothetical protein